MLLRLARHGAFAIGALSLSRPVRAEETAPSGSARAAPDQRQIEGWLATKPATADVSRAPSAPEAPPPPPRHRGFVVESSIGAIGQLGALKHVSPTAPWFHAAFGWEPTRWLMVLAQGDVAFASTAYAPPPPDPRGYALWGLGAGVRFGFQPSPAVGLFVEGDLGAARVTEDVLATYGFKDANHVAPYFGGLLGAEWYQISPHYALALHGGVRSYSQLLSRSIGSDGALAWIGAATLKYTF